MIKNIGAIIKQLKQKLPDYLEEHGINTHSKLFKCPNYRQHNSEDAKPSANFFPDKTSWHCFSCSYKSKLGDIFEAVKLLENKDITGENFFLVIKYLCDKYKIPYTETTTEEEKFFKSISDYLTGLTTKAHEDVTKALQTNDSVKNIINDKQWLKSIDTFNIGYIEKPYVTKVDNDILSYLSLDPKKIIGRIIIPIKNYRGETVGITTRSLDRIKTVNGVRYKHFVSYNLKKLLFNIDTVDASKEVIVVEGPSSVITLNSFGIKNVVATFGNYLHPNQYSMLVKKKVNKIFFVYDGDSGGSEGLRNSLESLCKGDIDVSLGILKDDLDPGDYVIKNKNLDAVKRISLYDYLVNTYKTNTNDKLIEKCLISYLMNVGDLIKKEQLINDASKKLKINKSTIQDLISIYQKRGDVSIKNILKERESLVQNITDFEKWSWSRGTLLGLRSFNCFDKKIDGVQNGLILVGGKPNIGKSAILITLALEILQKNSNAYVLYFTMDDPMYTTIARFIANVSELPINIVSNPNHRIANADIPETLKQEYINRRENAMTFLRKNASVFNLKDSAEGSTIEMIREKVKAISPLAEGKQLVVVLDSLHDLSSNKFLSDRQLHNTISKELNSIANEYKCPVIASAHVTKEAIKNKQYDGNAIKETVEFFYHSKLILFVDTDEDELESNRDDLDVKIIVSKNKMSGFKGYLPFTIHRSLSKIKEKTEVGEQGLFS